MARLFCETHGREWEAAAVGEQEEYQQSGVSVLIVAGRLISGPWKCDRCNARLSRGDTAYVWAACPEGMPASSDQYRFAYERQYFGGKYERAAAYGAAWPGGTLPRPKR